MPLEEIVQTFSELIAVPESTRLDICLLWDFLNFLTTPYLKGFAEALAPHLHSSSVAHGFGVLNNTTPPKSQQYGLAGVDELVVRPRQTNGLPYHPHPQSEIEKLLPRFAMGRSLLLSGGQLEMLLNART